MKFSAFIVFLFVLTAIISCDNREQKLRKKEMELAQKEQELLLREKELQLKEQAILKLDSQAVIDKPLTDSIPKDTNLTGNWSVKMTCTETDCEGSAIGDTKNEQWDISYTNNTIIAKARANNKLVRVYSGEQRGNTFELSAEQNAAETSTEAKMFVKLKLTSPRKMEGKREIFREGCKIIYSLDLDKQ